VVLNPWDEYAVEQALLTKEAHGGEITAVSLAPEDAKEAIKQSLAMGCDKAVLVSDPALKGSDSLVVSLALSAAITKLGDVDIVFFGKASVDSDTGMTHAQVARHLNWPVLSYVAAVQEMNPDARSITVERSLEGARQVARSPFPVVISVVKELNEPRYPSFMGIRKAARAEIPIWSISDLGLDEVPAPHLSWPEIFAPPAVETVCEFIEGETPEEMAENLADRLTEEKVV
jgi:electron transfer flavoprotein beta subunit